MSQRIFILSLFVCLFSCGSNTSKQSNQENPVSEPKDDMPLEALQNNLDPKIEDIERTEWQNPDLILDFAGDLKNKTVADIGAGSGYFTFKLARTAEKVIALDIDPKALEYIESQKEIVGSWSGNIEVRLTPPDVPNLLTEEADVVLIVNTYNYIPEKETYFPRLLEGMKPGGRLLIVDFKKGNIPIGPSDAHKAEPKEVRSFLRKASFRNISIDQSSLEYQYIITAQKR